MKRSLAGMFSAKALYEQESIIQEVIDRFIARVGQLGDSKGGLNMTDWYEMVAFDLLGEMAFGESFGSIESGE